MSNAAVLTSVIAQAIKATGVVIEVSSENFLSVVERSESALIVHAKSKVIRTRHKYLTSYKGLAFYTKVAEPLDFVGKVELVEARKIWIPEL